MADAKGKANGNDMVYQHDQRCVCLKRGDFGDGLFENKLYFYLKNDTNDNKTQILHTMATRAKMNCLRHNDYLLAREWHDGW